MNGENFHWNVEKWIIEFNSVIKIWDPVCIFEYGPFELTLINVSISLQQNCRHNWTFKETGRPVTRCEWWRFPLKPWQADYRVTDSTLASSTWIEIRTLWTWGRWKTFILTRHVDLDNFYNKLMLLVSSFVRRRKMKNVIF